MWLKLRKKHSSKIILICYSEFKKRKILKPLLQFSARGGETLPRVLLSKHFLRIAIILHILLRARLTPSCRSYLAVTSQTFSCLYRVSPPVSPSIECFSTAVIVVVSTCATPLENAEDTRYFRRTGRPSSLSLSPSRRGLEEGEGSHRYLSKHFVRGLDTWWIF